MTISDCCIKGFEWEGTPVGRIDKIGDIDTYVTGNNPNAAVLIVHDLFGWKFPNFHLLADHYAREANVTAYVPDFFFGTSIPTELLLRDEWDKMDLPNFISINSRENREPAIFECARALRDKHEKLAAVGFCYGGWAVFRLGAREHNPPLVDCIVAGHPSLFKKEDIDGVAVPVQMLAPEIDHAYTEELKLHTFQTIRSVPLDYQHFPGVEHSCLIRGDPKRPGEREAMVRGKNAAVAWMKQFLH